MRAYKDWLELEQVEERLCLVVVEQIGVDLDEAVAQSRFIEDLGCDSLDLIELIMETEDVFHVTIPETPRTTVGKQIFARQPFRIRDLAEYVFLNQGSGKPRRGGWRQKLDELPPAAESGFTQLGGRFNADKRQTVNVYEKLESNDDLPQYRRITDGMVCVEVPSGNVAIGCDNENSHQDESPRHSVELSPFLIDIEPISVTAFCRFLNSIDLQKHDIKMLVALAQNDHRQTDMQFERYGQSWKPRPGTAMQPVVMVSWHAADAYSRWANGHDWAGDGFQNGYLPTEAQWEYAAEGAFEHTDTVHAGIHQRGETYESSGLPIPSVHQPYGQSRFGLRHMSGTIWHWCRDWYSPNFYSSALAVKRDPVASTETGLRSERGGSWVGPIELCRPSYRRGRNPNARGRCLGFRCVGNPILL